MTAQSAGERMVSLLQLLDIETAHFAFGGLPGDLAGLASLEPGMVSSVTAVLPLGLPPPLLTSRPLVAVLGRDQATGAIRESVNNSATGTVVDLPPDYEAALWSDVVADQPALITRAIDQAADGGVRSVTLEPGERDINGVRVRVEGSGPSLVLLPGGIWPSQWDALVGTLAQRFTVIRLTGAHLGMFARLEQVSATPSSLDLMERIYRRLRRSAGDAVLDVGCGPGTHVRDLARRLGEASTVAAVEPNGHFLEEARALARTDARGARIVWEQGAAEELPFEDTSFDVAFAIRVIEECDADRAIAEMHRVLKPGGRIGLVVRATDRPSYLTYDLAPAVREAAEAPGGPVADRGCADQTLYPRVAARFDDLIPWPDWHVEAPIQPASLSLQFPPELREPLLEALERDDRGANFFARRLHCVVATKP
jgi:SAM-dependent methyltransferase